MRDRILVTGATGFVGRELCAELVSRGKKVIGVGRSFGANVHPSVDYHSLELKVTDLNHAIAEDFESVIHLAGLAHGKSRSQQQLEEFRRVNVEVAVNLARFAIDAGARRFVFVSSIGVHGAMTDGGAISETSPFHPESMYARSKLQAEIELLRLFETSHYTELTIVRPPLVYGVNAPGNFRSLLKLANSHVPLPFGRCENRRSLVSLTALVDFLITCADHPAAGNQSFVVSDSSVVSTKEIVASLRAGMGRAAFMLPLSPAFMAHMLKWVGRYNMFTQLYRDLEIDNRKACSLLGWTPCKDTAKELVKIGKCHSKWNS